jgi:hypothetical protein
VIRLKNILNEAKFDKVATKVWDEIISNKIHVTQKQLEELSNEYARKGHYNMKEVYEAVKRVAQKKNWFTKFIVATDKTGAGVF